MLSMVDGFVDELTLVTATTRLRDRLYVILHGSESPGFLDISPLNGHVDTPNYVKGGGWEPVSGSCRH